MHKIHVAGAVALTALVMPGVASAHVTVQPHQAAAGAETVENVRVPNEQDKAVTTKVDVQLPHGFVSAVYEATPGWTVKVTKDKLAKPVQTDDGPVTEEVRRITWTANSKATGIAPGQFRDFPLSVLIPGKAGDKLTFKALQTYSNGDIVRWIGGPDAEEPAPQLSVTAPVVAGAAGAKPAAALVASSSDTSGASKGLAIAALGAGLLGIAVGGVALVRRRP